MNGVTSMMMFGIIATTMIALECESFSNKPSLSFPRETSSPWLEARRRNDRDYYEDYEDDSFNDDYYDEDEYFDNPRSRPRRRQRSRRGSIDNLGREEEGTEGLDLPSPFGRRSGMRLPESVSKALLAGVFVLGIGTGVTVDSQINTSPKDLASRDAVDQAAPNPRLCSTMGASAMAFDQRVFVSFNPFNVYVAQADVKPACVLRSSNVVSVLQDRNLVNDKEIRACKQNMNTWAFVGDLDDLPQLSCVYKSEDAQNEFLSNPKYGIGEDVYDDDRANILEASNKKAQTKKLIKDDLTQAQKDKINKAKAQALKKDSVFNTQSEILEKEQIDI